MDITPVELLQIVAKILALGVPFWLWLAWRWQTGRQVLPYEPRRPVPWQGVDILLVMAVFFIAEFACITLGLRLSGTKSPVDLQNLTPQEQLIGFSSDATARLVTLCLAFAVLMRRVQATEADLGFVRAKAPFDVACGVIAFVSTAPLVYAVQVVSESLVAKYDHPLIDAVQQRPDAATWAVVAFSAVIVAPLSEEFFFRGLLQGWFEKIELAYCARNLAPPTDTISATLEQFPSEVTDQVLQTLPRRGLLNLPLGTVPILLSSLLFALTHLGQGAAPIPLFVLALVLGFLYQRTHRLLSSVVVHFLLNGLTVAMLFAAS